MNFGDCFPLLSCLKYKSKCHKGRGQECAERQCWFYCEVQCLRDISEVAKWWQACDDIDIRGARRLALIIVEVEDIFRITSTLIIRNIWKAPAVYLEPVSVAYVHEIVSYFLRNNLLVLLKARTVIRLTSLWIVQDAFDVLLKLWRYVIFNGGAVRVCVESKLEIIAKCVHWWH